MLGAQSPTFTRAAGSNYSCQPVTFQLDSASLVHRTPYGIPRSLHHMTATKAEKLAAVVQLQNVQHRSQSVLLRDRRSLCRHLTHLAAAAIACIAAVPS